MNQNAEFGYKLRQVLNYGTDTLDQRISVRLHRSRQNALDLQCASASTLSLAGGGWITNEAFRGQVRRFLAAAALSIGIIGSFYWNSFERTREFEEIDSELLSDELPPSIYLDQGFQAWLDRDVHSSLP